MEFIKDWKVTGALQRPKVMTSGSKEAKGALEGCFPFVTFSDTDVIVTPADVELCEVTRSLELIDEFGNKRKGSGIFDGDIVNGVIVLDGPKGATASFGNEEERYGKRRRRWANV